MGEQRRLGWRPRRTIMFMNWGGEEHGLLGSTEWVEQREQELRQRGIAYINVRTASFIRLVLYQLY